VVVAVGEVAAVGAAAAVVVAGVIAVDAVVAAAARALQCGVLSSLPAARRGAPVAGGVLGAAGPAAVVPAAAMIAGVVNGVAAAVDAVVVAIVASAAAAAGVAVAVGAIMGAKGSFAAEGVSVSGHWGVRCQGRQGQRRRGLGVCRALAPRQVLGLQGDPDTGARQIRMALWSWGAVESLSWRRYCSQALRVQGREAVVVKGG
jgi:hypothetical protein